ASGQELLQFKGHTDKVRCVAFSPDGRRLASYGGPIPAPGDLNPPGELKVWESVSGQEVLNLKSKLLLDVSFSPDGKRLASVCSDWTVHVWNSTSGQELLTLQGQGHDFMLHAVAFSPDGKRLVTGGQDQTVRVWDSATGKELLNLKGHTGTVGRVVFSPD